MASNRISTIRGLKIYGEKHKAIKALLESEEDAPEIHGDKVWFSSYFIIDYLLENPPPKKPKIMEIGCGWGLLGIFCAKEFKAKVIGVDADKYVFPFLDLHAKENSVKIEHKVCRYEKLPAKLLAEQDLILGGDICFWNELVEPLLTLIKRALRKKGMTLIIADPGRSPFMKLAKRCKKLFNAELLEVSIKKPTKEEGYLLIIKS
ncbi:methyltransferase domain-containing protein [Gammaproteobacteria bacterium]|nr:methyltransferase domain-containing protein [Gammaproteobacteria bacterium]